MSIRTDSAAGQLLLAALASGAARDVTPARAEPSPRKGEGESEAEFTRQVIAAARAAGWLCAHFGPARVLRGGREKYETPVRGDGKGLPDLVLARGGRVILAELKAERGVLSSHQERWVRESGAAVWRPAQWELIVQTLEDKA